MMGSLCSRLMNNYKTDRREGKPPHAIAMGGVAVTETISEEVHRDEITSPVARNDESWGV